jgi:hypothetical protein
MKQIVNMIASAKHWQIFTLLAASLFIPTVISPFIVLGIWLLGIGVFLFRGYPIKGKIVKIVFIISCITIPLIGYYAVSRVEESEVVFPSYMPALTIGYIYAHWFVARALKSFGHPTLAKKRSCILTFISFIYFPIGIWFLQPKINELRKNEKA